MTTTTITLQWLPHSACLSAIHCEGDCDKRTAHTVRERDTTHLMHSAVEGDMGLPVMPAGGEPGGSQHDRAGRLETSASRIRKCGQQAMSVCARHCVGLFPLIPK